MTNTRRAAGLVAVGILLMPSLAAGAEPTIVPRLRLQGGVIGESRPRPAPRRDDAWIGAVPELTVAWMTPGASYILDYRLTGSLHTLNGMSELSNFVSLAGAIEASKRTQLLLSADAAHTTTQNLLLNGAASGASGSNVGLVPATGSRLLTARVAEGLSYDVSPTVRFVQSADATAFTTLPPAAPITTYFANLGALLERTWENDALGADVRAGYAFAPSTAMTPERQYVTLTGAPQWRRDWSRSVSSSLSAGVTALFSEEKPFATPFARATVFYFLPPTTIDLTGGTGIAPNAVTGQLVQSSDVTLHVSTPLSERRRVVLGASVGYARTKLVDLRSVAGDVRYDAVLTDVDVSWEVSPYAQLFARYQFLGQVAREVVPGGLNPSFLRDAVLVGVQLSSKPPGATGGGRAGATGETLVPTAFPRRVDQADAQIGAQDGAEGDEVPGRATRRPQPGEAPNGGAPESSRPGAANGDDDVRR